MDHSQGEAMAALGRLPGYEHNLPKYHGPGRQPETSQEFERRIIRNLWWFFGLVAMVAAAYLWLYLTGPDMERLNESVYGPGSEATQVPSSDGS